MFTESDLTPKTMNTIDHLSLYCLQKLALAIYAMRDEQLIMEALPIIQQAIIDKTITEETKRKTDDLFTSIATIAQDYNKDLFV